MTLIRVISTKTGLFRNCRDMIINNYVKVLTEKAKEQPGFIKSKHYYPFESDSRSDYENIYVISDWRSFNDWNNWKNSTDREIIHNDFKSIIDSEEFKILHETVHRKDTFLL